MGPGPHRPSAQSSQALAEPPSLRSPPWRRSAPEPRERSVPQGREAALLRAAQMAVGGSSRDEIERALETELAISDPTPIVDELLGPRR